MSLSNLFNLIVKGGPGSGNKGHLGRPGKRGGSSPKGGRFSSMFADAPKKPTFGEFMKMYDFAENNIDTKGIPVYLNAENLPPVKIGHERLSHGTHFKNVNSISKHGLKSGKNMGSGEQIGAILTVKGSQSSFGNALIVFDLKEGDKFRSVNPSWTEVYRTVKPSEITGIVIGKSSRSATDLKPVLDEYRRLYGEPVWG